MVCTGNPPTNEEGQWVIAYWAPWLDPKHPNPAKPGELRWYTTIGGKDVECESGEPFYHKGKKIQPLSRTFIPSRVTDNIFLMDAGYEAILQALPEPLRSQMLNGDFTAGVEDSVWQIIPTAWVDAAMARWTPEGKRGEMDSIGVDCARGGIAKMVIQTRYGTWFDHPTVIPGRDVPDGAKAAGHVIACQRDSAPVHVDIIGVGGSVHDHLTENDIQSVPINGAAPSSRHDRSGRLKMRNLRAALYWDLREALDPERGEKLALPPDPELKADLCSVRWKLTPSGVLVEPKEDIIDRLGRSPDKGDALVYAKISTIKELRTAKDLIEAQRKTATYDPLRYGMTRQDHLRRR